MIKAEKEAKQLVDRFLQEFPSTEDIGFGQIKIAKQCALVCADEKLKSINDAFGHSEVSIRLMKLSEAYKKLIEVKQEIEKL